MTPRYRPGQPLRRAHVLKLCGCLFFLLLLVVAVGVSIGPSIVPWWQTPWRNGGLTAQQWSIFFAVRLPRVLMAALLGGALTVAGLVFQALLRNPLADPYVLGVSGGASLGGVIGLWLAPSGAVLGYLAVPGLAFGGALLAWCVSQWIATTQGRLAVYHVLLAGAVLNACSGAGIYLIQSFASLQQLQAMVFYLMGTIPSLGYGPMALFALLAAAALWLLMARSRDYNVLTLGDEAALQLGVDVEAIKRRSVVCGSLLTACAVSIAGVIGFVGLIVPHILRLLWGGDYRLLLPAGFLSGAIFLVLADLLARNLAAPNEIPIGVVTALLGAPFFLGLLRRAVGKSTGPC